MSKAEINKRVNYNNTLRDICSLVDSLNDDKMIIDGIIQNDLTSDQLEKATHKVDNMISELGVVLNRHNELKRGGKQNRRRSSTRKNRKSKRTL